MEGDRKRNRGDYPDEVESVREKKLKINLSLAEVVKASGLPDTGRLLVLDAPSLLTSRALIESGVSPSAILVANPFEKMEQVCTELGVSFVPRYSGYMLAREPDLVLKSAFLDWTCTLEGSSTVRPKKELATAFKRGLFLDGAILAFTLHVPRVEENLARFTQSVLEFLSNALDASGNYLSFGPSSKTSLDTCLVLRRDPMVLMHEIYDNSGSRMAIFAVKLTRRDGGKIDAALY